MSRQNTYREVLQFIEDQTSLIDTASSAARLRRLIHHATFTTYNSNVLHIRSAVVDVKEGIAKLPCDVIRLLRVTGTAGHGAGIVGAAPLSYTHDGVFVKTHQIRNGQIAVHYYGADVVKDELTGDSLPVIHEQQIPYCAFYAIETMLLDGVARGLINPTVYQKFEQKRDEAWHQAVGDEKTISMDDLNSMQWIMRNGIKFNNINYNINR